MQWFYYDVAFFTIGCAAGATVAGIARAAISGCRHNCKLLLWFVFRCANALTNSNKGFTEYTK
jgi:hypothetical protein